MWSEHHHYLRGPFGKGGKVVERDALHMFPCSPYQNQPTA